MADSLASGRAALDHRRVALAATTEGAARALVDRAPGLVFSGRARVEAPGIAFVHAGLGDHHPGMAAALYRAFPVFRASLDRSAEVLSPLLGLDVRAALVEDPAPVDPFRRWIGRAADRDRSPLSTTIVAQPALLALELALQALWASLGVVPSIVLGHSLGELAAAVAAGVFAPDDALALAAARARLIASLPPGPMTVVALSPLEIEAIDAPGVTIAVRSAPRTTVVAGSIEAVAALERRLAEREITCKRLDVEHAVHTGAMRPIAAALTDVVAGFPRSAPRIPYLSTVTGALLSADEATRPAYRAEHLCHAVALAPARPRSRASATPSPTARCSPRRDRSPARSPITPTPGGWPSSAITTPRSPPRRSASSSPAAPTCRSIPRIRPRASRRSSPTPGSLRSSPTRPTARSPRRSPDRSRSRPGAARPRCPRSSLRPSRTFSTPRARPATPRA